MTDANDDRSPLQSLRERAERAEANAQAWQDNYDGMFWRWAECDTERLALKDRLANAEMHLRLLSEQATTHEGI